MARTVQPAQRRDLRCNDTQQPGPPDPAPMSQRSAAPLARPSRHRYHPPANLGRTLQGSALRFRTRRKGGRHQAETPMLLDDEEIAIMASAMQEHLREPDYGTDGFDQIIRDFFRPHFFARARVLELGPGQYDFSRGAAAA